MNVPYITRYGLGLLLLLILSACSKQQQEQQTHGYLTLSGGIEATTTTDKLAAQFAKSVDASLRVQILYNNAIFAGLDYGPGEWDEQPISLPTGTYKLRAFTPNYYYPEASNQQQGSPTYFHETTFEVLPDQTTSVVLRVQQGNIAVRLNVPTSLQVAFPSMSVTVGTDTRTVVIPATDTAVYYFHTPDNATLYYTISATNTDGEDFVSAQSTRTVQAGKCYVLEIAL